MATSSQGWPAGPSALPRTLFLAMALIALLGAMTTLMLLPVEL